MFDVQMFKSDKTTEISVAIHSVKSFLYYFNLFYILYEIIKMLLIWCRSEDIIICYFIHIKLYIYIWQSKRTQVLRCSTQLLTSSRSANWYDANVDWPLCHLAGPMDHLLTAIFVASRDQELDVVTVHTDIPSGSNQRE